MSEQETPALHPIYTGAASDEIAPISFTDENGKTEVLNPIRFSLKRPDDPENPGTVRDQTNDAAKHMRYAHSLGLPTLAERTHPRLGRAVIVGGGPSVKGCLDDIKVLAADPLNIIIAINWAHTWLIQNGVIPNAAVFFEIDAEPDTVLEAAHPDVTYYICSHCHPKSFDMLKNNKRVLWHSFPNSPPEQVVHDELFPNVSMVGGGISTYTRAITVSLFLGYRHFDLFGFDGSFPAEGKTHVEGYETIMDNKTDGFDVVAQQMETGVQRKFRTLGYLALQVEEFKIYCENNHSHFSCRVHGDSLMRFMHENTYPHQYDYL